MRTSVTLPAAALGLVAMAVTVAGCSSGSTVVSSAATTSTSAPLAAGTLIGLGATRSVWVTTHRRAGSASEFGPLVRTGAGVRARYSAVRFAEGRVAGWTMSFPFGTRLVPAAALVRVELPADASQTASWRGKVSGSAGVCEIIDYRSARLEAALGTVFPGGAFGVVFSQLAANGSRASSVTLANTALVGVATAAPGSPCPT